MYFLRKDKVEAVKFSDEEYQQAKLYMQSLVSWASINRIEWWGPTQREYVGFATDNSQVQLQHVGKPILERLVQILQPKYYIDMKTRPTNKDLIPISELLR